MRGTPLLSKGQILMSTTLFLILCLNGLQYGMLLFLIAAGLTLVFGVMGFINLAHGVQYMVGAYLAFAYVQLTGSFMLAVISTIVTILIRCWRPSASSSFSMNWPKSSLVRQRFPSRLRSFCPVPSN